jgi:hypothetical protein
VSISHSLERAVKWHLWESPEVSEPRHSFDEAFFPSLDAYEKDPWEIGVPAPDLYQIPSESAVLVDLSIVMLAMDSKKVGRIGSRSLQAEYILSEAKNRRVRGFITPFLVSKLWAHLTEIYWERAYEHEPIVGAFPRYSNSIEAISKRLEGFCGGALEILHTLPMDMPVAIALAKETPVNPEQALTLAAMQRVSGPDFCVASADPAYAVLAQAKFCKLYTPSDIDASDVGIREEERLGLSVESLAL